jgi:predicted phage terminase large subunit-like protein
MTTNTLPYELLLRHSLSGFIHRSFLHLNPQTPYLPNWHIDLIAAKLEECRIGKIKRLIINLPPRNLKSICASVAFPAWILGHDPSKRIIAASYGQDLADNLALQCRNIMTSAWYRSLFPNTQLARANMPIAEFSTTQHGYRMATSVGGVLTGRGADFLILDDPMKPNEALSDALRRSVNEWYDHTLFSRLDNKETGCIIIIMQRLHLDDLVGHVLQQEGWEVLNFPAIAEADETHTIKTRYGAQTLVRTVTRRAGEALHPQRESLDTLHMIRETLGEYNFAGQYQQSPVPEGGGYVKTDWFQFYEPHERPAKFEQIVQSWDTASKVTELSDFSVCTTWGLKEKKIYLLDVLRKRLNYPELKRAVVEQHKLHQSSVILIEDKSSGTQLLQELAQDGLYRVKGIKPTTDKKMRLNTQTGAIENGLVYLPARQSWLAGYLHEMTSFPYGKHDDQVDSTSQALEWIQQRMAVSGLFQYYENLADEKRRREQQQRE